VYSTDHQHYDEELSNIFFEELGIPEPDYNLGVKSKSHGRQTAAMIEGIESVVDEVDPNVVLLYGDTNSTLAGAIVGAKKDTAVAHVEAGLVSTENFNRDMPEEINRILTDHVSDLLFAPIERAVSNLAAENITDGVYETGDVMYDTLLWAQERATEQSSIVEDLGIPPNEYVLATVHRPKTRTIRRSWSRSSTAWRDRHYRSSFQLIRGLLINLTNTDCWNMRRPSFDSSIQLDIWILSACLTPRRELLPTLVAFRRRRSS